MDPFSFTSGALQIAGACAQCTITIIKWVGDVRTVDVRIASFCEEVAVLQNTYEGFERSLSSPLMAEAARVASQTPDGADLWMQIKRALADSQTTMKRVNEVLNEISRTTGFARKIRAQLQESLSSGELSRLRQRIQFFNSAIALPIQMVCVWLQLEQRGMTAEHQSSLDKKLISLEATMRELVQSLKSPSRSQTLGGSTIVAPKTEGLAEDDGMGTYLAFARRFLETASAAASARSSLSTVSPAIEPEAPMDHQKSSVPDISAECDFDVEYVRTNRHLKLGQERVEEGDHAAAEKHFRKALVLMEKNDFEGRISFQPAEVVLMLAGSCLKQEKFDEAVALLEPVAAMRSDVFPSRSKSVEASEGRQLLSFEFVDKLQALAANHLLGQAFLLKADFDAAEEHALKAFTERGRELGPRDEKTQESVQLVVDIYRAQGDEEEAEGYEGFLLPLETAGQNGTLERPLLPKTEEPPAVKQPDPEGEELPLQAGGHQNSRSGVVRRWFGRSSHDAVAHSSPPTSDLHRLSMSRSTTLNYSLADGDVIGLRHDVLRGLSSPSESSTHNRSLSAQNDDESSTSAPSSGMLERRSSSRTIEHTFIAVADLCAERKLDQAVKVALQYLDNYHSHVMIVRKMELEKNIRRGDGKGLARTGRGYAPLHFFCELKKEHAEEVKLLIKQGVDVNAVAYQAGYTRSNPKDPLTPLQQAVERGYSTITSLLLAAQGIKTDVRGREGLTPLMVACRKGHHAIVRQLLEFGLPTDFPFIWHGNTLLHDAARRCDPVLVEMLVDRQWHPDIDARDNFGKTALMHAILKVDITDPVKKKARIRGRYDTVRLLLEAGADSTLKDNRTGISAREYAAQEEDADLILLLDQIPRTGTSELVA
jgi:tetratricopeptide (TPR) repeat protein